MLRRVIAGLVVAGLAFGVWLLWPEGDDPLPTSTTAIAAATTSTTDNMTTAPPTIAPDPTTTTTSSGHVVETVEEAETILRELWFGWFQGIYNEDEDRIREVVVTEETVQTAKESFGIEFAAPPSTSSITFMETEILRSDRGCLAVWTVMQLNDFREGSSAGVNVLRWVDDRWKQLSIWRSQQDVWEAECESLLS